MQGDTELVATVLGMPLNKAASILDKMGGLTGLMGFSESVLAEQAEISPLRAERLLAAIQLGQRVVEEKSLPLGIRLPDRAAVERWGKPKLGVLDHEELWVLCLDGNHNLKAAKLVAMGGIHGLHVTPRDVFRVGVREGASALVLVHNHPSGDPQASEEDIVFTRAAVQGASLVGVPILDHVIIAKNRSSSLLTSGLM